MPIRLGHGGVALTAGGRKAFFRTYEMRMDTLVTHPLFEYRVSYRRMFRDSGAVAGAGVRGRDCGVPGIYDAIRAREAGV